MLIKNKGNSSTNFYDTFNDFIMNCDEKSFDITSKRLYDFTQIKDEELIVPKDINLKNIEYFYEKMEKLVENPIYILANKLKILKILIVSSEQSSSYWEHCDFVNFKKDMSISGQLQRRLLKNSRFKKIEDKYYKNLIGKLYIQCDNSDSLLFVDKSELLYVKNNDEIFDDIKEEENILNLINDKKNNFDYIKKLVDVSFKLVGDLFNKNKELEKEIEELKKNNESMEIKFNNKIDLLIQNFNETLENNTRIHKEQDNEFTYKLKLINDNWEERLNEQLQSLCQYQENRIQDQLQSLCQYQEQRLQEQLQSLCQYQEQKLHDITVSNKKYCNDKLNNISCEITKLNKKYLRKRSREYDNNLPRSSPLRKKARIEEVYKTEICENITISQTPPLISPRRTINKKEKEEQKEKEKEEQKEKGEQEQKVEQEEQVKHMITRSKSDESIYSFSTVSSCSKASSPVTLYDDEFLVLE